MTKKKAAAGTPAGPETRYDHSGNPVEFVSQDDAGHVTVRRPDAGHTYVISDTEWGALATTRGEAPASDV